MATKFAPSVSPFDPSSLTPVEEGERDRLLSILERDGQIVLRQHPWATFAPLLGWLLVGLSLLGTLLVLGPRLSNSLDRASSLQIGQSAPPVTDNAPPVSYNTHVFETLPPAPGAPVATAPPATLPVVQAAPKLPTARGALVLIEVLAVIAFVFYGLWLRLTYRNRYFVIHPARIVTNTSVLSRNDQQLPIARLSDTSFRQPVISRVLCALSVRFGRGELYWSWADDFGIDTQGSRENGFFDKLGMPRVIMSIVYELLPAASRGTELQIAEAAGRTNELLAQIAAHLGATAPAPPSAPPTVPVPLTSAPPATGSARFYATPIDPA